jgi:hypothetical protein
VFVLQVVAVLITTRTPTAAQVGVDYSFQLLASGGDGDYTFTPGTGMPPGLTMSQAGLVVGTPTTVGTSTVQVTVADGSSHTATSPVVFEVDAAPVVVPAIVIDSDTSLPGALVGQDYSVPLEAHGGSGTLAWSVSAGALPDGLFLSPGGVVVGNPTTGGDFTFTAFVSDSETPPKTQVKVFTVHVDAPVTGERYDFATTPTTTEMIVDGTGVTVTGGEARVFGGTNYTTQRLRDYRNFRATVKVTPNLSLTTVFRLVPSPTTTDDTVLSFALVQAPSSNLLARSFQASAEDEVDLGLSAGSGVQWWRIQFNEGTGEMEFLRATAAEAGPYTLLHSLELDDPADAEALCARLRSGGTTSSYTPFDDLDISPLNGATGTTTPTITTTGLADAVQGSPYSKTLAVVGGSGVKVWSVTAGTLPAGLSLNASTGVISGTPTGTGTSSFTVQASVGGVNATKALTITVGSSGAVVPYTGPKLGTVATLSLILDNELPFWSTPKNALAKMVELGFDGFAFGGVGEVSASGPAGMTTPGRPADPPGSPTTTWASRSATAPASRSAGSASSVSGRGASSTCPAGTPTMTRSSGRTRATSRRG